MKKPLGLSLICAICFSTVLTMCNSPEPAEQTHEIIEQSASEELPAEQVPVESDTTTVPKDSLVK